MLTYLKVIPNVLWYPIILSNLGINYLLLGGKYDGMAPNAKLSFMDLGKPGTGLCIPSPVQLYGPGYIAGARVHSNSWGSQFTGNGYYSSQATDEYLYKNQVNFFLSFSLFNN